MSGIDEGRKLRRGLGLGLSLSASLLALLSGCSSGPTQTASQSATQTAAPRAAEPASGSSDSRPGGAGPQASTTPALPKLGPPQPVRNHDELRRQAALRLVAANPEGTYMSDAPAVLLAIPVLEVELRADGSVREIHVLRRPGQAEDTVQLAIDAVHRAAPFGDISRMPKPWKFSEVFLFDDDRRFKPRTLD